MGEAEQAEAELAEHHDAGALTATGEHPAGEIRLSERRYGVRAAVLAGMTAAVGVAMVTAAMPGTTGLTTGP